MSAAPKSPEGELLERAVHDLKNALAVVRSSLEWLEVELKEREDALDAVRDAATAAERLVTIVEDLDSLARLDAAGSARGDRVLLAPLIDAVVVEARAKLTSRSISVEASVAGALETTADGRLLGRSLAALVQATARGASSGAVVEVTAAQTTAPSGATVNEVRVGLRGAVDDGASEQGLDALESSGLGVYVALRVVTAHHGSLTVVKTTTSSRIIVRLPL